MTETEEVEAPKGPFVKALGFQHTFETRGMSARDWARALKPEDVAEVRQEDVDARKDVEWNYANGFKVPVAELLEFLDREELDAWMAANPSFREVKE